MNDSGTLPLHMLDVRELTPDAFTPFGQVIAPIRTGDQGAETHYHPETSAGSCRAY
jgi:ureidoglycolate hydrolase